MEFIYSHKESELSGVLFSSHFGCLSPSYLLSVEVLRTTSLGSDVMSSYQGILKEGVVLPDINIL